jgi:hypothetical protein
MYPRLLANAPEISSCWGWLTTPRLADSLPFCLPWMEVAVTKFSKFGLIKKQSRKKIQIRALHRYKICAGDWGGEVHRRQAHVKQALPGQAPLLLPRLPASASRCGSWHRPRQVRQAQRGRAPQVTVRRVGGPQTAEEWYSLTLVSMFTVKKSPLTSSICTVRCSN